MSLRSASSEKRWAALIVAAGRGTRFGAPKQLVEIAGRPMLEWSLRAFARMPGVSGVLVVTEREWLDPVNALAAQTCAGKHLPTVAGGATRQESVHAGLLALPESFDAVLVHDGARPLLREDDVRAVMEPVRAGHGALLGVPAIDTIKVVREGGIVDRTLERSELWAAQTPQSAMLRDLLAAHEAGVSQAMNATDDAMLLEQVGVTVHMVAGSPENFKVTLPEDRERAEQLLRSRFASPSAQGETCG